MSEPQTQDIETDVATDVPVQAEQDNQVANDQVEDTEETDDESPEVDANDDKAEEPIETVEQRLERLEKDVESKSKAINRKTAAYHDLQRAYERQKQEFEAMRQNAQPQETLEEPSENDFETYAEYMAAVRGHERKVAKQEVLKEIQEHTLKQQQQKIAFEQEQLIKKQEAEYIKIVPNYEQSKMEVQSFITTSNIDPEVGTAVLTQAFKGNVPQLFDFFGRNNGENIDKLQEIAGMSPIEAAVEIYKIQQTLKTPERQEKKPAPKPVNKPKGGGAPRKDLSKGSVLENLGLK